MALKFSRHKQGIQLFKMLLFISALVHRVRAHLADLCALNLGLFTRDLGYLFIAEIVCFVHSVILHSLFYSETGLFLQDETALVLRRRAHSIPASQILVLALRVPRGAQSLIRICSLPL